MRGRQATTWRRRIDVRTGTSLIPLRRVNVRRVGSTILKNCRKVLVPRGFDVFAVGWSSTFRERRAAPIRIPMWREGQMIDGPWMHGCSRERRLSSTELATAGGKSRLVFVRGVIASSTLAERLRCFFVPSPERPVERGRLRIAEQVRDLADRQRANRSDSARPHPCVPGRAAAGTRHLQQQDGAGVIALTSQASEQSSGCACRRLRRAMPVLGAHQEPHPPVGGRRAMASSACRWSRLLKAWSRRRSGS